MRKIYLHLSLLFFIFSFHSMSGQVGIGTATPAVSSMLDITSTNSGVLIPRIALISNTDVATIASPTTSLLVYNSGFAPNGYYYWNGALWVQLAVGSNSDWSLTGNSGTTPGTNFIGTIGTQDLRVKTNSTDRWNISDTNNGQLQSYSLGSATTPTYSFQGDQNTGLYSSAADALDVSTGGTARLRFPNTNQVHALSLGTAALPFYSFSSQTTTGIFGVATDILGFSTGGTERLRIPNANQVHASSLGTAALPFYSYSADSDTGIFSPTANNLAIATNGTEKMRIDANGAVGIGTSAATGALDVTATANNYGFVPPRVALTATNVQAPVTNPQGGVPTTSTIIFNNATAGVAPNNVTPGLYYWNGAKWVAFGGGTGGTDWSLTGNGGTTAGTNFVGTTDNIALRFKTNNADRFEISNNGFLRSFADGTAALPAYSWNSSTDMGIFRVSAGVFGLSTVGAERMRVNTTGQVVINSTAPFAADRFSVYNTTTSDSAINGYSTLTGFGVYGQNTGTSVGVYGLNNSTGYGVYGSNNSTGIAVRGSNTSTGSGVYGNTAGSTGAGVFGVANVASGSGVYGTSNGNLGIGVDSYASGTNGTGVSGYADNTGGDGVIGEATQAGRYGVWGINNNATGNGVNGTSSGTTGVGVIGSTTGTDGTGVIGSSSGTTADGVYGQATGASGYGVWGLNNNATGNGVVGSSTGSSGIGVFGSATGATGTGVFGQQTQANRPGVIGLNNNATGIGINGTSTGTTGIGIYGTTTGTDGTGVIGSSTGANADGVFGQATGAAGYGVWGINNNAIGNGVVGSSSGTTGTGVFGSATGSGGSGMFGSSSGASGFGVWGFNSNASGTGVIGAGNNLTSSYSAGGSGGAFTGNPYGTISYARTTASGIGIAAAGNNQFITLFDALGAGGAFTGYQWGVTGIATITGAANDGLDRGVLAGSYISGSSTVDNVYVGARIGGVNYKILGTGGGSVSTTMKTTQGEKILFAPEAPENWFFDVGEVTLVNGSAKVQLDPIFVETISDSKPFKVFVQGGENTLGAIRITRNQKDKSFLVEDLGGSSNGTVQYNIYAIWKGKENLRFPELNEKNKPKPTVVESRTVTKNNDQAVTKKYQKATEDLISKTLPQEKTIKTLTKTTANPNKESSKIISRKSKLQPLEDIVKKFK